MSVGGCVALLDLPWLLLEGRPQHMHIAGLMLCRPPSDAGPEFVPDLVTEMRHHDRVSAPFDRRLRRHPLKRIWPQWETVNRVDLTYHVREATVSTPGDTAALEDLVARLHEQPLDLAQPLWQLHVVTGLHDNRFGLYVKFHHALTDGVGAIRILQSALATVARQRVTPIWAPTQTTKQRAPQQTSQHARVTKLTTTLMAAPRALALVAEARRSGPRATPYVTPHAVFNGAVTRRRRVATLTIPTTRLRDLADAIDGTINDALLATCATALRTYLLERNALPRRPLTAAIPVSVRATDGAPRRGHAGNALSFAFANLATSTADDRRRTRSVIDSIRDAKQFLITVPEELRDTYTVLTMAPFIGAQLLRLTAASAPMFNVAISNFTGSPKQRYYGRAAVDTIHPISILQSGQALNITALSYADHLHVTFTACPDAVPHLTRLADSFVRALDVLQASHTAPKKAPVSAAEPLPDG